MNQDQEKRWFFKFIFSFLTGMIAIILFTVIVDPYFHYHAPIDGISYRLYEERYTNDGISRHFEYDTIITGTSMNQNFKPSEWDALTGSKTVKLPYSGGSYYEISNGLRRAIKYQEKLDTVIWGLDYDSFIHEYDYDGYGNYPEYLYDDNLWNDTSYVLNKSILYHGTVFNILKTLSGEASTTMDEYSSWNLGYGMEAIMRSYIRPEDKKEMQSGLTEDEKRQVKENIQKNIVDLANENPQITFYLFYTPYSIVYWDELYRNGLTEKQFEAEAMVTEILLECPNIKLYNFYDNYELICDTDNYKDKGHYVAEVNSWILRWLNNGEYLVDQQNWQNTLKENREFYLHYDYDIIF